jgi:uncharacterized protein (TIGR03435 family)
MRFRCIVPGTLGRARCDVRRLLTATVLLLTMAVVAASTARLHEQPAQTDQKTPAFEVASVKPNTSGDTNGMLRPLPGGRMTAANMPVRQLITFAYQVAGFQLIGGPAWLADRYDVVAKMDGNPDISFVPGVNRPNPMQVALQRLLEDRFKLKVRRETREMDIYALVMAKPGGGPGPNLKRTTQDCAALAAAAQRKQPPPPPGSNAPFCGFQGEAVASASAACRRWPSRRRSRVRQGMVVDRTGLTGGWDFEVTFAPPHGRGGPDAVDPNLPDFFTAIQEQLGLKLESTKGPVDVLVIDHVEKPTPD